MQRAAQKLIIQAAGLLEILIAERGPLSVQRLKAFSSVWSVATIPSAGSKCTPSR